MLIICIYLLHISSFPPFFGGRLFVSNAEGAIFPLENPSDYPDPILLYFCHILAICQHWPTLELVASAFRVCLVPGFAPTDVFD